MAIPINGAVHGLAIQNRKKAGDKRVQQLALKCQLSHMIRQRIAKMDDVKQHQKDNKKDNYHYSDKYRRLQLKAPSDLLTLSPQYKQYRRYYQKRQHDSQRIHQRFQTIFPFIVTSLGEGDCLKASKSGKYKA